MITFLREFNFIPLIWDIRRENRHNHSNFKHPATAIRLFRKLFTLSPRPRAGNFGENKKGKKKLQQQKKNIVKVVHNWCSSLDEICWLCPSPACYLFSALYKSLDNNSSNGAYTARRWDFGLSITISHLFLRFGSTYNFCQIEGNVRGDIALQ